jgi:ribosomal protein S12 methylthiotransferase
MRYHLVTLGCPKNVVDSEHLSRLLAQARHEPVEEPVDADVIVVNTCGFIDASIEESTETVKELAAGKRPEQKLIVAGCMTQLYGPRLLRQVPTVDAVFGVNQWEQVAELLGPADGDRLDIPATGLVTARPSAYLKISDGCDRPCTFCIIPTIKGRMTSLPADDLLIQARRLVGQGVKELILVAQDSTDYASDLGQSEGLADLLLRLAEELPELPWIRLMYAYPGAVSRRLARVMASLPQVCHYIDVPLQHGSRSVLQRMRRPSNPDTVRQMVDRLRAEMPDIAIRTTFIVGSPAESEAEFSELLAFVEEMQFDRVGVFTYSPQKGTPMEAMEGQLPEKLKRRRYRELMELQQAISYRKNAEQVGRELDVLVESEPGQRDDNGPIFIGRTYRDAPEVDGMAICRGEAAQGDLLRVRISAAGVYDVFGSPVHEVTLA